MLLGVFVYLKYPQNSSGVGNTVGNRILPNKIRTQNRFYGPIYIIVAG